MLTRPLPRPKPALGGAGFLGLMVLYTPSSFLALALSWLTLWV